MKTKIIITLLLMLVSLTLSAQKRHQPSDSEKQEQYRAEVREAIGLDYSMPDYSINKVDAQVMGTRLAQLVDFLCENYDNDVYVTVMNRILEKHIKGLQYPNIKKLQLDKVTKTGNEITMSFDTTLYPNNLNKKHVPLVFTFVDGISESKQVNGLFAYIGKYVTSREKLKENLFQIIDSK